MLGALLEVEEPQAKARALGVVAEVEARHPEPLGAMSEVEDGEEALATRPYLPRVVHRPRLPAEGVQQPIAIELEDQARAQLQSEVHTEIEGGEAPQLGVGLGHQPRQEVRALGIAIELDEATLRPEARRVHQRHARHTQREGGAARLEAIAQADVHQS